MGDYFSESWHEWVQDNLEEDIQSTVVCLICDQSKEGAENFLQHMKVRSSDTISSIF